MDNINRPTPKTDYQNFIWNTISFLCFVYLITFGIFMEHTKDKTPPKLTPETDAEAITPSGFEADDVPTEFARKLERERDEAREERDKLQVMRKEVVAANKGAKINAQVSNSLAGKLNQAERERDEAREDAATYYARFNELKDVGNKLADECDRILGLGLHQNTLPRFKAALEAWRKNN